MVCRVYLPYRPCRSTCTCIPCEWFARMYLPYRPCRSTCTCIPCEWFAGCTYPTVCAVQLVRVFQSDGLQGVPTLPSVPFNMYVYSSRMVCRVYLPYRPCRSTCTCIPVGWFAGCTYPTVRAVQHVRVFQSDGLQGVPTLPSVPFNMYVYSSRMVCRVYLPYRPCRSTCTCIPVGWFAGCTYPTVRVVQLVRTYRRPGRPQRLRDLAEALLGG